MANYVNNKHLYEEMKIYHEEYKRTGERPKASRYIGESIILISEKLSNKHNFRRYTYKDEMIADGIETCMRYMHNYDPEKSKNPFAYFTRIIYNAFVNRIKEEQKQHYLKLVNGQKQMSEIEIDDPSIKITLYNDTNNDAINLFEDNVKKRKEEANQKKSQNVDSD